MSEENSEKNSEKNSETKVYTKKQKADAVRRSVKNLKDQDDTMAVIEQALRNKEMATHLRKEDRKSKANQRAAKSEKELTAKPVTTIISPKHVAAARRKAFNIVMANMDRASEVLEGKRKWTNQQVQLFGKLVNKVIPDLHHSVADVTHNINMDINTASVEDLMRIAMDDSVVIDGSAEVIDTPALTEQPTYSLDDYRNDPDLIPPLHIKHQLNHTDIDPDD